MAKEKLSPKARKSAQRTVVILELLANGVPSDQIEDRLRAHDKEIGNKSELFARESIAELKIVRFVKAATEEEDYAYKTDFFVYFKNVKKHGKVSVQVKSSQQRLKEFMSTVKPDVRLIGLYVEMGASRKEVQDQFLEQLENFDGVI